VQPPKSSCSIVMQPHFCSSSISVQSHRSRRLASRGVPPRPPPDHFMWRSRQLLQRRSGSGHAFSCGYVWLESVAKPVSRVLRKAVVAAVTDGERDRLHVAQHTFIVKRQLTTLCVASCQSESDFGHVASAVARCRRVFGKRVLAKARPVSTGSV